MKRFIFAIAAVFAFSTIANAQNTEDKKVSKKKDKTEMVKKMTERMVERYALNEDQSAKLQKLNEEFAGKMRLGNPGPRPRMGQRGEGFRGPRNGNMPQEGFEGGDDNEGFKARPVPNKEEMEKRMNEMKKNAEEYEAQLKTIMTEEQYVKYSEDRQKMHQKRFNRDEKSKE